MLRSGRCYACKKSKIKVSTPPNGFLLVYLWVTVADGSGLVSSVINDLWYGKYSAMKVFHIAKNASSLANPADTEVRRS